MSSHIVHLFKKTVYVVYHRCNAHKTWYMQGWDTCGVREGWARRTKSKKHG